MWKEFKSGKFEPIKSKKSYKLTVIAVLFLLCIVSFLLNVSIGSYKANLYTVIKSIFIDTKDTARHIIFNIRLPRTIVAALVGVCLSISGAILQGVMRNPLASPNIIGVSSGAGLVAIITLVALPDLYYLLTPLAFVGAISSTLIIYLLSWKGGIKPLRLILSGIALSSFLGAGISTLMIFFPEYVQNVIGFMVGGLSARSWKHFHMIWPYALAGFVLVNISASKMNILTLGDEVSTGLGLRIELTRIMFVAIASLLAASSVSVVGLLGFVGLIVPHIARLIIGPDYKYLFTATAVLGAFTLMTCDLIARIILDPVELPVGIIMSALGAPFFLYLLRKGIKHDT